jgi:hypothetical protein
MPETQSGQIENIKLDGTDEGIDDNTQIDRYMKLETFLLLLANQVFIPSLDRPTIFLNSQEKVGLAVKR